VPYLIRIVDGGLDQHQLRGRIDTDVLAVGAEKRELASGTWQKPREIPIPEPWRSLAGRKVGIRRPCRRRVKKVLRRNDLVPVPKAVIGEKAPEPRIIAENRIEATMCYLKPLRINYPSGIGFCADRLP